MADEESIHTTRKSSGIFGILSLVALALVLYVLSVGPVARYYEKRTPPKFLHTLYAPLGVFYENFPPARTFFDWYAKLWGTHL